MAPAACGDHPMPPAACGAIPQQTVTVGEHVLVEPLQDLTTGDYFILVRRGTT